VSCGWGGHSPLGVILAGSRAVGATDKLAGLSGKTMLVAPKDDRSGFALAYSSWRSNNAGEGWNQGGGRLYGVATRALGHDLVGHANLRCAQQFESPPVQLWALGFKLEFK